MLANWTVHRWETHCPSVGKSPSSLQNDDSQPQTATLDILEQLVAFPIISAESNLELIGQVGSLLTERAFGPSDCPIPPARRPVCWHDWSMMAQGGLLSAHSNVVPVAGQEWMGDPFRLRCHDEMLFGRGTTDMRGFMASMLSMAQHAAQTRLNRPPMIAIACNEEVGHPDTPQMLPSLKATDRVR
ncbi:M20/M25/M40 family metallo-hydrolase [Paracoccus methylarcula]|uniref:M20/M25/M40 family metallo-hydrolase n=1 Tax=Paracoccus methylarcula TaxID=72022 RepID=A0A3R7LLI5_9RHOB|nr:hypothetical protein A7A09_000225 [Paracoccus methylarcula]